MLLFLYGTTSDDLDDIALCDTDDVEKRNVRRTAVEAASALDTILNGILFEFVHHGVAGILVEKERLESHRTGLCTFSTTDTCRLNSAYCLFCSKIKQ